tara:strand:- start:1595 stop:2665 length:1071 start_codon:yes stop_codon:yes gene_type:complete
MALQSSGQISASDINTEADLDSSAFAPLAITATPQASSLVGLYETAGVDQNAPHAYSEFYGKTFVAGPSPYWTINTTNLSSPNFGKKYTLSGTTIIQNTSDNLGSIYQTDLDYTSTNFRPNGAGSLTLNSSGDLVIGGSMYDSSTDHKPVITLFNSSSGSTRGVVDIQTAYDWNAPNHYCGHLHFIDGFSDKIFWADQEDANDADSAVDRRRYGVVSINTTTFNSNTYPKLWQYTGWARRLTNTTHQQGYKFGLVRSASYKYSNSNAYIYVVNQIKNENLADDREYNAGIVRLTYNNSTSTGSTSIPLTSPIFKVWVNNSGYPTNSPWTAIDSYRKGSDSTRFDDVCVITQSDGGV